MSGIRRLKQCYLPKYESDVYEWLDKIIPQISGTLSTLLELNGGDPEILLSIAGSAHRNERQQRLIDSGAKLSGNRPGILDGLAEEDSEIRLQRMKEEIERRLKKN